MYGKSTQVSIFSFILTGFCPCCALDSGHRKGERERRRRKRGEKKKKNKKDRKRERERERMFTAN